MHNLPCEQKIAMVNDRKYTRDFQAPPKTGLMGSIMKSSCEFHFISPPFVMNELVGGSFHGVWGQSFSHSTKGPRPVFPSEGD